MELSAVQTGLEKKRDPESEGRIVLTVSNEPNKEVAPQRHPPSFFTDQRGNLKFVNLVCAHPCKLFTAILTICLALTVLLGPFVFKQGNPFVTGAEYDMADLRSSAYDSFRLARDEIEQIRDTAQAPQSATNLTRPQEETSQQLFWIFESETNDGVFGSRRSIESMKAAFDLFTTDLQFESFCKKDYEEMENGTTTSECAPILSPLNMYYASEWDADLVQTVIDELARDYPQNVLRYNFLGVCVEFDIFCPPFVNDEDFEWAVALNKNITRITDTWDGKGELNSDVDKVTLFAGYMNDLNTKRGLINFGFDKGFDITNLKSTYSRGIVFWGGPLDGRDIVGAYNRTERRKDDVFLKRYIVDTFLQDMKKIASEDFDPEINSYFFSGSIILEVLFDIVQRDASLALFSFLFVCVYIRISLGSSFLALVGLLEIGLSIPVAWFVFSVCFRIKYFSVLNTLALFIVAAIGADDIFIFMDAYKQSATPSPEEAYILESLESRMSWVYRRSGSAMAITSATTCLAFLCTLATPLSGVRSFGIFAALVVFVDYVLVMTMFCTAVVIYHNKFEKDGCCPCFVGGCCKTAEPSPTAKALENVRLNGSDVERGMVSKFFGTKLSAFILNPVCRLLVAIIFIAWLIVASIFATKLEPTKNTEQFLDENHSLQKSFTILGNEFNAAENDRGLEIFFTWGLGDVDRKGTNLLLNPDFFGTPVFLDTFKFDEQCQLHMVQACDDLKAKKSYTPFIKQTNGLGTVKCFMEEFGAYAAIGNLDNCEAVKNGAWKETNWTVPSDKFSSTMKEFLEQESCFSDRNANVLSVYKNELGWDGTDLKYAGISIENSILDPYSSKAEMVAREQYDAMIKIAKEFDARMEKSCGSKVIMTDLDENFTFMNNQRIYVQSAVFSSLLGIAIAFSVLLLSTRLFHIALLATLSISCVLISVIGVMVMIGWELGSVESILISVVAGFSVDYVVHLAHSYERAVGDTNTRIKNTFWEMGISVMNGMITSVGASIPLFFCQLQFFSKFGTFLCSILAFSWVFANFAFMAVLAQLKMPIAEKRSVCGI